jgi:hypothetical protein
MRLQSGFEKNYLLEKNFAPIGQCYAHNHGKKKFFKYLARHAVKTDSVPQLARAPAVTVTQLTTTNVSSLEDERRLRSSISYMPTGGRSVSSSNNPTHNSHHPNFKMEYLIQGYEVQARITERPSYNPMYLWVAGHSGKKKSFLIY